MNVQGMLLTECTLAAWVDELTLLHTNAERQVQCWPHQEGHLRLAMNKDKLLGCPYRALSVHSAVCTACTWHPLTQKRRLIRKLIDASPFLR
jgi:hypothetical protein